MKRTIQIVLIVFFPIFGLLWLGGPWAISKADFELTGQKLFEDTRERFTDLNATSAPTAESAAWLESNEAAKLVLGKLPRSHTAALAETGQTWSVKLRERMRTLACNEQIEAWQIDGKNICSWTGEWLKPKTNADRIEVIQERLSINRSGDGRHLNITFRAADHDMAMSIVNAFGNALERRHGATMRELRRRAVDGIEAEFAELTRRKAEVEASIAKTESRMQSENGDFDPELLLKFVGALQRARSELPENDPQQVGRELEAVKAVVREKLLGQPEEPKLSDTGINPARAGSAAVPSNSLMLLNHPDWSMSPVIRLSETTASGFSILEIAVTAFVLSILIGAVLSRIWPTLRPRSAQHDFYASPYANPHWPNIHAVKEAKPDKTV